MAYCKAKSFCQCIQTFFCIFLKWCNRRTWRKDHNDPVFLCSDHTQIQWYNYKSIHFDIPLLNPVRGKTHRTNKFFCCILWDCFSSTVCLTGNLTGEIRLSRCQFLCISFCQLTCQFFCLRSFFIGFIDQRCLTLSRNRIIFRSSVKAYKLSFCLF